MYPVAPTTKFFMTDRNLADQLQQPQSYSDGRAILATKCNAPYRFDTSCRIERTKLLESGLWLPRRYLLTRRSSQGRTWSVTQYNQEEGEHLLEADKHDIHKNQAYGLGERLGRHVVVRTMTINAVWTQRLCISLESCWSGLHPHLPDKVWINPNINYATSWLGQKRVRTRTTQSANFAGTRHHLVLDIVGNLVGNTELQHSNMCVSRIWRATSSWEYSGNHPDEFDQAPGAAWSAQTHE